MALPAFLFGNFRIESNAASGEDGLRNFKCLIAKKLIYMDFLYCVSTMLR